MSATFVLIAVADGGQYQEILLATQYTFELQAKIEEATEMMKDNHKELSYHTDEIILQIWVNKKRTEIKLFTDSTFPSPEEYKQEKYDKQLF